MIFEIIKDAVKLAIIAVMLLFLVGRYVRWRRPHMSASVERHRLTILTILGAVLVAIKVSEDALTGDSGPADEAILLFLRANVPPSLVEFFKWVTLTGSFKFFVPLSIVASIVFAVLKRWFDVLLVVCSTVGGGCVIYFLKLFANRERPALWETEWYWGTSFPSGHTLETACVGMALALSIGRLWPAHVLLIRSVGLCWVLLVALSRLVLGVHWPTDVLAAACIGMLIPIAAQLLLRQFLILLHFRRLAA
jgi:undecaprenyl-diphosphatase